MGCGVAQALAETGHAVILMDDDEEVLSRAQRRIAKGLRLSALLGRRSSEKAANEILDRIAVSTYYEDLAQVQFLIENVVEHQPTKLALYRRLDEICESAVVFAANTSAIPISLLASATWRPDRFVGLHFMNPVPLMSTVEMIRGPLSSPESLETSKTLIAQMGKETVVVNDSPGFVTNRVMMLTINESIRLFEECVAPAEEIDRLFKTCFGHKMGPLETSDLIGLDTVLLSLNVLQSHLDFDRFLPASLLIEKVEAGHLGRKSGQGFYDYRPDTRKNPKGTNL